MSASARADQRFRVVLSTASSLTEAKLLARMILKKRLAACVNLLPGLQSWYWWKGRMTSSKEVLLLIKTTRAALKPLLSVLRAHHSYDLPEFIVLPVTYGDPIYLEWIKENVTHSTR